MSGATQTRHPCVLERTLLDIAPPAPRPVTADPITAGRAGGPRRVRTSHGTRPGTGVSGVVSRMDAPAAAAARLQGIRAALQPGDTGRKTAWGEMSQHQKEDLEMLWNCGRIPGRFGRLHDEGARPRVLTPFTPGAVNSALLVQVNRRILVYLVIYDSLNLIQLY